MFANLLSELYGAQAAGGIPIIQSLLRVGTNFSDKQLVLRMRQYFYLQILDLISEQDFNSFSLRFQTSVAEQILGSRVEIMEFGDMSAIPVSDGVNLIQLYKLARVCFCCWCTHRSNSVPRRFVIFHCGKQIPKYDHLSFSTFIHVNGNRHNPGYFLCIFIHQILRE